MITKTFTYQIANFDITDIPYTWSVSSPSSCVSFAQAAGTVSTDTFAVTLFYEDEDCITDAVVNIDVISNSGCTNLEDETISNVNFCENLQISSLTQNGGNFSFTGVLTSPDCTTNQFEWTYDTAIFNLVSITDSELTSTLVIEPKGTLTTLPSSSTVTLTATNCNGCTETQSLNYAVCTPILEPLGTVDLTCGANFYTSAFRSFTVTNSCSSPINYAGTQWTLPDSTWSIIYPNAASGDYTNWYVQVPVSTTPAAYVIQARLVTTDGRFSNPISFTARVNSCDEARTILLPPKTITLDCARIVGDVVSINIEQDVVTSFSDASTSVDWSTWSLIDPPTPASGTIVLATDINGDHIINYTVASTTAPDAFGWTVCDTNGLCANATIYTVSNCDNNAPVVSAAPLAVACNSSVSYNLLTGATISGSQIDASTTTVVTTPTKGTVTLNGGTATYIPTPGQDGADSFTFNVKNISGTVSNTATITVNIVCAGEDATVTVCD